MRVPFLVAAICTLSTACQADGGYWVVGNSQTNTCDIVTSNPVLNYNGPLYFGSGTYGTLADAKLARSTIGQCPKVRDKPDENNASTQGSAK